MDRAEGPAGPTASADGEPCAEIQSSAMKPTPHAGEYWEHQWTGKVLLIARKHGDVWLVEDSTGKRRAQSLHRLVPCADSLSRPPEPIELTGPWLLPVLCSFLISSRGRPESLRRTIQSIINSARRRSFEVIVRACDDDEATADVAREFVETANLKLLRGPKLEGYHSVNAFAEELVAAAQGVWSWLLGDDVVLTGDWDTRLRDLAPDRRVEPEASGHGGSTYRWVKSGPFPCGPTQALRGKKMHNPIDRWFEGHFLGEPWFLPGVRLQHH